MLATHSSHAFPPPPDALYANSGGPSSRTRTETIRSSILGMSTGPIRCPLQLTVALDFGGLDPYSTMLVLLEWQGIADAQHLRDCFDDLPGPMLCIADPTVEPLLVASADAQLVLRAALLLGLCTAVFYDPSRPVIWTHASLTRRLRLYETEGFYA